VGDVRADVRAQSLEGGDQEGRRGDPVGVKVPVDDNGLLLPDGLPDAGDGPIHPIETVGIIRPGPPFQERAGVVRISLPLIENLDDHRVEVREVGAVRIRCGGSDLPAVARGHGQTPR
jgi:hypothetical protein